MRFCACFFHPHSFPRISTASPLRPFRNEIGSNSAAYRLVASLNRYNRGTRFELRNIRPIAHVFFKDITRRNGGHSTRWETLVG